MEGEIISPSIFYKKYLWKLDSIASNIENIRKWQDRKSQEKVHSLI